MLKIRPLYSDEAFEVNGESFVFTNDKFTFMKSILPSTTPYLIESGWAFYIKSVYSPICVVAGKPGHWRLYYYCKDKGLLSERIAIPRAARYRIMQIVEENPA